MTAFTRTLALVLLAGTALLGAGAAVHPMLAGDAASQLRTIAETEHWRGIHLAMLAGTGLIVAGIWVRLLLPRTALVQPVLLGALAIIAIGIAIDGLNIAYMAGSGWRLGDRFAAGDAMAASIFDLTHPIGLMAARFGNFLVALGALALGWAEWRDATTPRVLAILAWAAGIGGMIGVLFFDEASRATLGAVALLSGWQVVTAVRAIRGAGFGAHGEPAMVRGH
jgi:hypothetical protein